MSRFLSDAFCCFIITLAMIMLNILHSGFGYNYLVMLVVVFFLVM